MSAQRAILRDAFTQHHGTEGDSFFVVFRSAVDAVAACLQAQLALTATDWLGGVTRESGWACTPEQALVEAGVRRS